jgi:eukaryotic-like serine/threonine-protein kinase
MAPPDGTRIGPYEILTPLGAGGMGEVYRATDSRLKRQVAIKILPPALAGDPDRLARFQREAEILASLNHPHIAAIYGLEDAAGVKALVMELVDGPTLADRIAEGPLRLDEALPIARQIAEALESAHERGIIHRDLKPANIKVREDGTVKVLDFGLAKLTEAGGTNRDDASQSPTLTSPAAMTTMGMIVGTAAYMSPEQARGKAVDKRTDVWAFGAVLYEMVTGARAFEGDDLTEVMASVLKTAPKWTALPADVPRPIVTLIQRCLEKDRNARIGDMAAARFLLTDHAALDAPLAATAPVAPVPVASTPAPRWRPIVTWALPAVVVGTGLGWLLPRRETVAPAATHLQMSVQPADQLVGSTDSVRPVRTSLAISPDGRLVVFNATRGTVTQLFARGLDRVDATPIAGTQGASWPFLSPDGRWIGFLADNKIKKVPAAGGPAVTICDVPEGRGYGASWGDDGTIVFANRFGISTVSSDGGSATRAIAVSDAKGERLLLPKLLPGARDVMFTAIVGTDWGTASVVLQSLDGGERRILIPGGADARYVGTGHLVFMKSGTLMAVPFDVRSRQLTGAPVAVIEGVMQAVNTANTSDETGVGQFALSASGTLLYATGGVGLLREESLVWVDRKGIAQPFAAAAPAAYLGPRLSPDGRKVAVSVRSDTTRPFDVWVYDVVRGAPTRLTFDGSTWPVWSPDAKRVVYRTPAMASNLAAVSADGGGAPERITTGEFWQIPSSWSSAAGALAFLTRAPSGSNGIYVLPSAGDRTPRLFLESRFSLMHPDFSPDGRWLAYVSLESGNPEVYVQPYPGPGEKFRISTSGGFEPVWVANGREILYRSGRPEHQQFFSVTIRSLSPFSADSPQLLFEANAGEYDSTAPSRSWDVSADGQRFLLLHPIRSTDTPVTTLHVVLNWTEELTRLTAGK